MKLRTGIVLAATAGAIGVAVAAIIWLSCRSVSELGRVASPDGRAIVHLTREVRTDIPLPGPEPPRVTLQRARITLSVDGERRYDSGFEDIGVHQPSYFAYDVAWAPDSAHVAIRAVNKLCVLARDGTRRDFDVITDNSLISSFKWRSSRELIVVTKLVGHPLDMFGYPDHYHGYLTTAGNVRILSVNLDSGITERFSIVVGGPTFMFHALGFKNNEISPSATRVAFSDGSAICVYDDSAGRVIARASVAGSIEGTWWDTEQRALLGVGFLSSNTRRCMSLDVATGGIEDQTSALKARWDRCWERPDWFRIQDE